MVVRTQHSSEVAEKAQRGARDTAFAAKEGTEKALNAVSDAIA